MNNFFRQQEQEAQERKIKDLEWRLTMANNEIDTVKRDRDQQKRNYEDKIREFDSQRNKIFEIMERMEESINDLRNYNF